MSRQTPAFDNFRRCVDEAPAGTYEDAKALATVLGDLCNTLLRDLRALGLKADNCDRIYRIEAALYDYASECNPDSTLFPTAEGFGDAMQGPARNRVLQQAASNLATLRGLGVVR